MSNELTNQTREGLAWQKAEENARQKQQASIELSAIGMGNMRAPKPPPSRQQITYLVAAHFADGDYATAERWLKGVFK